MAKVGILTFHHSNNYGAVLQACSLYRAVERLGHTVEVLDYRPLAARRMYGRWWISRKVLPISLARWRYYRFRQHHLQLSRQTYWAPEDLWRYPAKYDCLICGSDQVWNIASRRGFDPPFFLDFAKDAGARRISYAATFGHTRELGCYKRRIRELLSSFDYLSVRDRKSQNMIYELTGRAAEHVLDPTFLTDYESNNPMQPCESPYIFVYCMARTDFFARIVCMLRQRFKMTIISPNTWFDDAKVICSAGPLEWISLIRHSEFVCTNSFHGICLSLISKKQFVALPNPVGQSRLEDILQTVDLLDRLVRDEAELENCLANAIQYDAVSVRLDEARCHSEAFLREALS